MKKFALWLSAVAVLATASGASRADYSLFITTSADANNLHVGDTVTFDVNLSGINPSDSTTYLSYLAATITFDSTLLSGPSSVPAGAIIPDPTGFLGTGFSGEADASYDGFYFVNTPAPIVEDGIFFSFQVKPHQAGDGTLSFSAASYTLAPEDQHIQSDANTVNLNFHIDAGSGTAVPEPSAFLLLISGMFGLSTGAGLRGLIRRVRLDK